MTSALLPSAASAFKDWVSLPTQKRKYQSIGDVCTAMNLLSSTWPRSSRARRTQLQVSSSSLSAATLSPSSRLCTMPMKTPQRRTTKYTANVFSEPARGQFELKDANAKLEEDARKAIHIDICKDIYGTTDMATAATLSETTFGQDDR